MRIPHDAIRATGDRSWSMRLVQELVRPGLGDDAGREIARTLAELADPRAVAPLINLLETRDAPVEARERAGLVLRDQSAPIPRARLHEWWHGGDEVLKRQALLAMAHDDAAIIGAVAADAEHPLHHEAIQALEFGFEEPVYQAAKIAALGHRDARVRHTAALALTWDEPLAGEAPLLLAATCDPVAEVAVAALDTLRYYKSRRCLLAVASLRQHADEHVREAAEATLHELRGELAAVAVAAAADPTSAAAISAWMEPVAELVDVASAVIDPIARLGEAPPRRQRLHVLPPLHRLAADELIARYADLDGPWAARQEELARIDWVGFDADERTRLGAFFVAHPDPWLRGAAAPLLAAWSRHEALHTLVGDAHYQVMKTATYALGTATPAAASADLAWTHLGDARVTSTHARETLATYVHHADPAEAVARLEPLVRGDARESVRSRAVQALDELGARATIARLAEELLDQPPLVTWSVHLALLQACARPGMARPSAADALLGVDNAEVQAALCRLR